MGRYIPEEKISEIRNSADIVAIISEAVLLKKAGRNYLGLCPFHSEKTPSFTVSPEKQMFHCFGCGEGGNVFSFLMKHQHISFPEAAMMLARRYNIDIPRPEMTAAQKQAVSEREKLLTISERAARFFRSELKGSRGDRARRYLADREMPEAVIEEFGLGYAPPGWDNLLNHLKGQSIPPRLIEKAGLVAQKNDYYDRFRDRVIFPITDIADRVVGFGGRVLDDSLPKYLNSPETPLYSKSRILYGLGKVKHHCRQAETVYITEGYMDFLALYRHGIKNAVATLGTSLTIDHVRLLKGYVRRAVLVFDSDAAGVKAAQRAVEIFNREKGLDPYILTLPEGHDPDTYMLAQGPEAFMKLETEALGAMSFLIETAIKKHGLSVEGRIHVIADLEEPLAAVQDSVARAVYVKELAERVGVDETAIFEKIKQVAGRRHSGQGPGPILTQPASEIAGKKRPRFSGSARREQQIVSMMIHVPTMLDEVDRLQVLAYFENPLLKDIGQLILDNRELVETGRLDELMMAAVNDDQRYLISSLTVGDDACSWENAGRRRQLIDQVIENRRGRRDSLSRMIVNAAEMSDSKLDDLLKAKKEQQRDRRKLYARRSIL